MGENFAEDPVLHFGEVGAIQLEKGFSFIKCSDSGFDSDIFVHKSVVDPSTWVVGDRAACSIEVSAKGNPKATAPVWKLASPMKPGIEPEFGKLTGEVAEINDAGNAFIECEEIMQQYGKRAFCHSKVMGLCQLQVGDVIVFHLHVNGQGLPQVSLPVWKTCSNASQHGYAPQVAVQYPQQQKTKTWHTGTRDYPPAKMPRIVDPPYRGPPPQQNDDFFFGRVKHVDQAKGYSLIESPDSGYERDISVKSLVAPPVVAINIDDVVAFKVENVAGRPNAVAPLWKLAGGEDCDVAPELGTYVGRLARRAPEGNGFVESEAIKKAYGKDAFVHFNVMKACHLEIGDTISFDVVENARGQPQIQSPCWKCCSTENIPSTADTLRPVSQGVEAHRGSNQGSHQQRMAEAAERIDRYQKDIDKEVAMQAGMDAEMATLRDRIKKSKERQASLRSELTSAEKWGLDLVHGAKDHSSSARPAATQTQGGDDYYMGCIKHVDVTKGHSMVECPDTGHEKDVFVHKGSVDPSLLQIGDHVAFPLHWSARGDPQASAPFWKLVGVYKETDVHFGEWFGRLKDPLPNGSSFVEGDELKVQYGREAYIHQSVIDQCALFPGELIAFRVHVNQQGFPQATTPVWKLISDEKWKAPALGPVRSQGALENLAPVRSQGASSQGAPPGKGKRKHSYDEDERSDKGSDKGKGKRQTTQNELDGSYAVGWVQTVDEGKSHYLVEVPGAGFDRGIYMPFSTAQNLSSGDTVFFMLQSSKKGSMQASSNDVVWKLVGREPTGNVAEIGTFIGKLKEANQNGGMHVNCPELKSVHQQEAYVLKEVAEEAGFAAGDTIYFDVHWNKQGKPQVTSPCWKNASPYEPKERSADTYTEWTCSACAFANSARNKICGGNGPMGCKAAREQVAEVKAAASFDSSSEWSCSACGFSNGARNKICGGNGPMGCNASREQVGETKAETPRPPSGVLTGVHTLARVKSINERGLSSFLQAAHPSYKQDVYAHQKTVDPQILALGDVVFFQIHLNSRNMPQAAAPLWKIMGSVPSEFDVALVGTYKGKLESNPQNNGSVIVECPEVEEKFGSKAVIDADVLEDAKVQPGETIFFDISGTTEEGTPQISTPLWKCCSAEWHLNNSSSEQMRSALDEVVGTSASFDAEMPEEQAPADDVQDTNYDSQQAAPHDPRPAKWTPNSQPSHEPTPPETAPRMASPPRDPRRMEPTPPAIAPRRNLPLDGRTTKSEQFKAEGQDSSPVLGIPMRAASMGSQLKEGDIAVIHSLSSEAGKQLNDLRVTIMKVLDTGRMQVRFMPEANRPQDVRLKSANLKLAPA